MTKTKLANSFLLNLSKMFGIFPYRTRFHQVPFYHIHFLIMQIFVIYWTGCMVSESDLFNITEGVHSISMIVRLSQFFSFFAYLFEGILFFAITFCQRKIILKTMDLFEEITDQLKKLGIPNHMMSYSWVDKFLFCVVIFRCFGMMGISLWWCMYRHVPPDFGIVWSELFDMFHLLMLCQYIIASVFVYESYVHINKEMGKIGENNRLKGASDILGTPGKFMSKDLPTFFNYG